MLGPGTDEFDDMEDTLLELEGVPFIVAESFMEQYGTSFRLVMEEGRLTVKTVS